MTGGPANAGTDTSRGDTTARDQMHELAAPDLATARLVELDAETGRIHASDSWRRGAHAARTLLKGADLRLVLVALHAGDRLAAHQAPGSITIQTLSGALHVGLPDRAVDVPAGHLLSVAAGVVHDVEAEEESTFLLTVAAPADRAAPVEREAES